MKGEKRKDERKDQQKVRKEERQEKKARKKGSRREEKKTERRTGISQVKKTETNKQRRATRLKQEIKEQEQLN